MRILIANKFLTPHGGVEAHAVTVTKWLEESGHTVVPFGMAEEGLEPSEHSRYFPSELDFRMTRPRNAVRAVERATLSSETRRKLTALLDAERIDAAYVLNIYHQLGTVILNDLADRGIPTVLSLHDYKIGCPRYLFFSDRTGRICTRCLDTKGAAIWAPVVEGCWSGSRLAGAALSLEAAVTRARGSYRRPGAVVVLNSLQERAAISAGVAPERIHRIAHPVTLAPARQRRRNGRALYAGRLSPEKGVAVVIEAAAVSGIPVTIAGSGPSETELRALAERLSAPVEFLGSVDHTTVDTLMAESTVLVVPSVCHDVSPLVVYEAVSADLPVVGSRVGGVVEQLNAGRGLLVEPADVGQLAAAMTRVATDEELGRELSATARAYAEEYLSPTQWSQNMMAAFRAAGAREFAAC